VPRTDVDALARAMEEWPLRVKAAGVKRDNGVAYNPRSARQPITLMTDDPPKMLTAMLEVLDSPAAEWDNPDTGSAGWNRIVAQAGPELTWEWLIMDPNSPWADLFTAEHRWKVAVATAHTLKRLI
jgi:hypothetical protein